MKITAYNPLFGIQTAQGSGGGGGTGGSSGNVWKVEADITYADFVDTGVTIGGGPDTWGATSSPIYTLPLGGIVLRADIRITESFRGGAYSSYSLTLVDTTDVANAVLCDSGTIGCYPDVSTPVDLAGLGQFYAFEPRAAAVPLYVYTNYSQVISGLTIGAATVRLILLS